MKIAQEEQDNFWYEDGSMLYVTSIVISYEMQELSR